MCGIAGVLNLHEASEPVGEGSSADVRDDTSPRTDEFGIYLDRHVGLGSARLSIIDVDGGQQPIGTRPSCWIVYNGGVFNHSELRAELETRGHCFKTRTDTEVILHAYEEFGPECLNRFNGQFAIAIWDSRKRQLFLARDRLGVRPLFYTQVNGTLIFGSEIKAILADPRVRPELDLVALYRSSHGVPFPSDLLSEFSKCRPATTCFTTDGTTLRHWS
jgi:asparagine synthase (glutamine-hydrolysing)